jgi:uncharacterized membrane protein
VPVTPPRPTIDEPLVEQKHEVPPFALPPLPEQPQVPAFHTKSETPLPPPPPRPPRRDPPAAPPPPPIAPEPAPSFAIDWEAFVGVKLFSAIAGIALVLAAIFFLRYSIEQGWLGPPIRVAIGVIVATALLVVCELKAARKYEVTANALDAAAIAILFATFYAAHALWDLIPASVTFGLLILVTVLAVLLSIRHESRFIAVLGLLGGFATPALLSTGENRPISLFTYLLLLNAGLAWVAFKKGWPQLTILTLILTVIYQWGWVFRFLATNTHQVSLAMGIFLVFSVMSFVALILSRRGLERGARARADRRRGGLDAVALCDLPRLCPAARRQSGPPVRVPVPARRRPADHRHRSARRADARDCRRHDPGGVRDLAGSISGRRADDGDAVRWRVRSAVSAGADDCRVV